MSDYSRTTLAYPVIDSPTGTAVVQVMRALEAKRDEPSDMLIRTFVERPDQYVRQEGDNWPSKPPRQIADVATMHTNLAVHLPLLVDDTNYDCAVLAFKVGGTTKDRPKTFLRISFPSLLTGALRGTQEFGGRVRIDETTKGILLGLSVRTAKALATTGFAFGPEGAGWPPFTNDAFESYLKAPLQVPAPMAFWFAGIDEARVSRADLLRTWQPESPLLQSGKYNIVDVLHDRDGEDDEGDEGDEDPN